MDADFDDSKVVAQPSNTILGSVRVEKGLDFVLRKKACGLGYVQWN